MLHILQLLQNTVRITCRLLSIQMWWLLVAVALVPLASPQCLTPEDSAAGENPSDLQIYQGQKPFTLSMLKSLNTQDSRSNLFFSPLSVYSTLLLAYFISSKQTEKSLLQTLHLPDDMVRVCRFKLQQLTSHYSYLLYYYQFFEQQTLF